MINGLGIDIIEIERIQRAREKNPRFVQRLLTETEQQQWQLRGSSDASLAGYFAAKEAVAKALGTGIRFSWHDIEVFKDELGKPWIKLYNKGEKIAYSKGIAEILVSISHSREYAVAQAIALGGRG